MRYTTNEFAKKNGVTRRTVYNWIKKGIVRFDRIGRKIMIITKDGCDEKGDIH